MEININIKDKTLVQNEKKGSEQESLSDAGASAFSINNQEESISSVDDNDAGPPSQELVMEIESYKTQQKESGFQKNDYNSNFNEEDFSDAGGPPEFDN
ncbi:hypothetical protein LB467_14495 [Salegentibacter sp. JZCK2]|uniref:hypothetical protein n=1 Tax=Salegentibacter tibetensis TaxID=2873600 RepID=UPI001CCF650C|nr:hypothetical protein [Salegentibacter tibetensis]MBZ9730902.1 hypothetical protein [Salegentibacter tibetensis]